MTYDEAMDPETIVSALEARMEIVEMHQLDDSAFEDFMAEYGVHEEYRASDVLAFLGY